MMSRLARRQAASSEHTRAGTVSLRSAKPSWRPDAQLESMLAPPRTASPHGSKAGHHELGWRFVVERRDESWLLGSEESAPLGTSKPSERSSSARASHRFGSNPATPRLASFIHTRPSVRSMSSDDSSRECRSQTSAQRQRSHVDVLLTCSCAYTFRLLMA